MCVRVCVKVVLRVCECENCVSVCVEICENACLKKYEYKCEDV